MKNGIILGIGVLGIGVLILLLTLVGPASAHAGYQGANCGFCHVDIVNSNYALTTAGSYFRDIHKFDGADTPYYANSCLNCHTDLVTFLPLTSNGSLYNVTHRYDETTLASKLLPAGGCNNCHVNAAGNATGSNFNLRSGTPTYLTSAVCQDCHKAKYDNWTNTLHAVMLTPANKAQAMNLPTPPIGWANTSYVVVTKFALAYINLTGYFPAQNDTYFPETEQFAKGHGGEAYGTCGRCHTTGYNASAVNSIPAIKGNWSEPGIACERCHGPGGNGHQVVVNYSGNLCRDCHTGGNHGTGWENGEHAPPAAENGSNCMHCHSPFDKYKNPNVTLANTIAVSCGVCHNIHDMTDSKYADTFSNGNFNADTWSEVADAKSSFFNATASLAAGTDIFDTLTSPALLYPGTDTSRKDASYGTAPIKVTGPVSGVLCSKCHYRHGLAHTAGVNLTHATYHNQSNGATCTDCHMKGTNATVGKDMMKSHSNDIFIFENFANSALADPANSCGGTARSCHTASSQNLSKSSHSMVPVFKEWNASAHNDKVVAVGGAIGNHFYGTFNATTGAGSSMRANTCLQCHSPQNWNAANTDNVTTIPLTDFHGITCMVCHNLHDMGAWLNQTKAKYGVSKFYGWYNKTAIKSGTRYQAAYTMMDNTTQLCGNCHTNIRAGSTGPGWASATAANPISQHGIPAADVFAGSWKQTSLLNFECIDCHWSTKTKDSNGNVLPDSQKVAGHSFKVNVTLLQNDQGTQPCSNCHATGSSLGNLSTTIANVQESTHDKWNTTNATVMSALATIKAYSGEKNLSRTLIATAYWNLKLVSSEGSWGVHNPTKDSQLLSDAATLANQSIAALGSNIPPGPTNATQTTDPLVSGYNLIAVSLIPDPTIYANNLLYTTTGGIPGVTKAMRWNSTAQQWEGYEYIAAAGVYLGNNFALEGYKAYFIKGNASTAGQTYTFRGRRQ
jgi:formate-dependent nitrite reductase cytochrome c552 subunit